MTEMANESEGPFWVEGDMMFRVAGTASEPDRLIKPRRPFAIIGRTPDCTIAIENRAISARHVYLHLDHRGVYAVDLITRTGMRINGVSQLVGWLRPGDWLEVGGRKIELLRIRHKGVVSQPKLCEDDLLAHSNRKDLPTLVLEPSRSQDAPWVLGSELVFLGWSTACGIQIKDSAVSRTHCAIVRSSTGAFLVDLCGSQTWVEAQPVVGSAPLHDGDMITLGTTRYTISFEDDPVVQQPQPSNSAISPYSKQEPSSAFDNLPAPIIERRDLAPLLPPIFQTELVPTEAQAAFMTWMVNAIQGGHNELIRRQGEFQVNMTQLLQQLQRDNANLLTAQLERIESIDNELASLRAEIERRNQANARPELPNVTPLKIARPDAKTDDSPDSKTSTNWLLNRVNQLEEENKSAWKDLLGRIAQPRKAP